MFSLSKIYLLKTKVGNETLSENINRMTTEIKAHEIRLETDVENVFKQVSTAREILNQIHATRNDNSFRINVSSDYQRVRISNFSKFGTLDHYLEMVRIPDDCHSTDMKVVAHSLPLTGTTNAGVFQACGTIQHLVAAFQLCLDQMETFYEHMNTIDELCLVVHPVVVTTKSNMRTFKLDANVFVKFVVDPFAPASLEITIIGPSYGIGKYRQLYDERIADWDSNLDIHANLLRLFDMTTFPIKTQNQLDDADEPPCGICLDYRVETGQIPIVSCDNVRCDIVYHTTCLRSWFQTLPESKTCLDVTFGMCPYCKEKWSTSYVCLLTDE